MVNSPTRTRMVDQDSLPPVTTLCIVTMILVVIGGIYMAAYIPKDVPMALPIILTVAAVGVLLINIVMLSRVREFAWDNFRLVFGCSLAGYGVISGLLLFVFIRDDIPGEVMTMLAATLVIFAVNIPLLFGFSVARYQFVEEQPATGN